MLGRTSQDWGLLLFSNQRPTGVYFGRASLCTPAISVDASVQPWVIPTYASVQIGNTQCKCVCTTSDLFGKWLEKYGSSKNSKVVWQAYGPDGRSGVADCNAICHTTFSNSLTRELPVQHVSYELLGNVVISKKSYAHA